MPLGVIALTDAIHNNRALTTLNLSNNKLVTKAAGKALGEMLKTNTTLLALDVSRNCDSYCASDGTGFVQEISKGFSYNGSLTTLDVRNNGLTPSDDHTLVAVTKQRLRRGHRQRVRLQGVDGSQFRDLLVALLALGNEEAASLGPLPSDLTDAVLAWL